MAEYKIAVPDAALDQLRQKLALASFPDELSGAGWSLGAPLDDVKRLADKWRSFDWRAAEAELNTLPQYKTDIEVAGFGDLGIHYVHQRSGSPGAIPLLFCHGCAFPARRPGRLGAEAHVRRARQLH